MLGNLHVRFGVGAGVKLPGLHHSRTRPPTNTLVSNRVEIGHADLPVRNHKLTSTDLPVIPSLLRSIAMKVVAIFLSFVLAALRDQDPCDETRRQRYALIAPTSPLRGGVTISPSCSRAIFSSGWSYTATDLHARSFTPNTVDQFTKSR